MSPELHTRKRELRQEAFHLRMQQQADSSRSRARFRAIRREVARVETVPRREKSSKQRFQMSETATTQHGRQHPHANLRKTRVGQVVSDKMNKTAVVKTVTRVPHAKFGKIVKQVKKFYAHDEENKAQVGDTVRIMETRPLSKLKRWRLVEIVKH